MRRLLTEHPDLDGVFAASDLMAHAALRTLREAGRRVPDDVAVVGFDDIETAAYTEPPLTTVRQPIVEIGRRMTRTAPAGRRGGDRAGGHAPHRADPTSLRLTTPPAADPCNFRG